MVQKSKGPRRRTRSKLRIRVGEKKSINKYLQKFEMGSRVLIKPDPSSSKGRPFRRFFGLTGTVMDKRGESYIIKIKDCGKEKTIIARPEHLEAM